MNLGLVGYWPFDDGSGTVATDFSGNGYTGTLNTGQQWVDGKRGRALNFNNSSDFVSTTYPASAPLTNWTMSAWVYDTKNNGAYRSIIQINNRGDDALYVYPNNVFGFWPCGVGTNTTQVPANQWVHVVATYDSVAGFKYYQNGNQVGTSGTCANAAYWDYIRFGGYAAGDSERWGGKLDEIRIYNRALSATEVTTLYQSGSVRRIMPDNAGLVGYWSFNDGSGTIATDFSGKGNPGTLSGTALPSWSSGKRGGGLSFDGSTAYVQVSHNANMNFGTGNFSIAAWVNRSDSGTRILFGKRAYPPGWVVYLTGNSLAMQYNDATPRVFTLGTYPDIKNWHHIAVVINKSANQAIYYLDGVANAPVDISATTGSTDTSTWLGIGRDSSDPNYNFYGMLDEVRLYNRALNSTEVAKLAQTGSVSVNSSRNSRLTSGLVGEWSFDGPDVSGTMAYDRAGSGYNGVLTNGASTTQGKVGQALNCNSSRDQYMTAADPGASGLDVTSAFTLAAWVYKTSNTGGDEIIINKEYVYEWRLNAGQPAWAVANTSPGWTWINTGLTVPLNEWTHLVLTYDGSSFKSYVNGTLGHNYPGASGNVATNDSPLMVCERGAASSPFNGKVDDVRVYNRALSPAEVLQLYSLGK